MQLLQHHIMMIKHATNRIEGNCSFCISSRDNLRNDTRCVSASNSIWAVKSRSIDLFAQLRIIEKFEVLQASKKFDVLILRVLNFKIKIIPQGFNGYDQLRSFTSIENENGNWEKPT